MTVTYSDAGVLQISYLTGLNLEEIGISAGNWVNSAQDRNYWRALVNAALNLRVPQAMELVMWCDSNADPYCN